MSNQQEAYKIYMMATHGLLSSDAQRCIEDSDIDEVLCHSNVCVLSIITDSEAERCILCHGHTWSV